MRKRLFCDPLFDRLGRGETERAKKTFLGQRERERLIAKKTSLFFFLFLQQVRGLRQRWNLELS